MKKLIIWPLIIFSLIAGWLWISKNKLTRKAFEPRVIQEKLVDEAEKETKVIGENFQIPWEIVWLPSGEMLVTERPGNLLKIGTDKQIIKVEGVAHAGEGGLMGLALHPNFATNKLLYLYLTSRESGQLVNRVERYRLDGINLIDKQVIVEGVFGASYHDGGRIAFGPDGKLYITTGDAGKSNSAQDTSSLNGKILRVNDDGSVPDNNPFDNLIYSYGHRNPQGLSWDSQDRLWITEHGPSGINSGFDEVNLIVKGGNYGWPKIQADEEREGMISPVIQSGADDTWAPAGMTIVDNQVLFTGLRGEALYQATIVDDSLVDFKRHFLGQFGRLRIVTIGPDGNLYLATSNTDGRGEVSEGDDKIIKFSLVNIQ